MAAFTNLTPWKLAPGMTPGPQSHWQAAVKRNKTNNALGKAVNSDTNATGERTSAATGANSFSGTVNRSTPIGNGKSHQIIDTRVTILKRWLPMSRVFPSGSSYCTTGTWVLGRAAMQGHKSICCAIGVAQLARRILPRIHQLLGHATQRLLDIADDRLRCGTRGDPRHKAEDTKRTHLKHTNCIMR